MLTFGKYILLMQSGRSTLYDIQEQIFLQTQALDSQVLYSGYTKFWL